MGSRLHKALEYYLRANMPKGRRAVEKILKKGLEDGDSPLRQLPRNVLTKMRQAYSEITKSISESTAKILAIEQRYRYLHNHSGQVEGVIDVLLESRDGAIVLKEWKSSAEVSRERKRQYELQARTGALGVVAHNGHSLDRVEIVPVLSPRNTISITYNESFVEESKLLLDRVFRDLRDRSYKARRGKHCSLCQLKTGCPAHRKGP
jgi:CRISPR/Cas system-associated exonuclease Cas4 (RecB family)